MRAVVLPLLATVVGGLMIWRAVVMADRVHTLRQLRGESVFGARPERTAL